MPKKSKSTRKPRPVEEIANDLVALARLRYPTEIRQHTVGHIVDQNLPWTDPNPHLRNLMWEPRSNAALERLVRHLSHGLIGEQFSTSTLQQMTRRLAADLGHEFLEHRDSDRLMSDAAARWTDTVNELEAHDERWDIVLPIENLRLGIKGRAVSIGPVLIVRDPLAQFLWSGTNETDLAEFGQWAIERHGRDGGPHRATFDTIYSYAKVESVPGEISLAVRRATRDARTALTILRLIYFMHGSFAERERFGSTGDFYDPIQRFDLTGSLADDVRITLTSRSISQATVITDQPTLSTKDVQVPILDSIGTAKPPDDFNFRFDRIGMSTPVDVAEATLTERWPLIETLAAHFWSDPAGWSVLATAARWFAEGVEAATREDAFIKFAIAIDVLVGRGEKGYSDTMTNRVAERVGFLLGENDPSLRRRITDSIRKLFDRRGSIVHGQGKSTDEELWRLESIARLIILRMAWEIRTRKHQNVEAFIEWVTLLKFGERFTPIEVPRFLQISEAWFETD